MITFASKSVSPLGMMSAGEFGDAIALRVDCAVLWMTFAEEAAVIRGDFISISLSRFLW